MRTDEIIKEIQRLPIQKRILVIEKAINSIPLLQTRGSWNPPETFLDQAPGGIVRRCFIRQQKTCQQVPNPEKPPKTAYGIVDGG
jgi:hypothetical protein